MASRLGRRHCSRRHLVQPRNWAVGGLVSDQEGDWVRPDQAKPAEWIAAKLTTINQVADLYELQPWQRDLLAALLMWDRIARRIRQRTRQSFLAQTEASFNRIIRKLSAGNLDAFITNSESQPAVTPPEDHDQEGEAEAQGPIDPQA